ncbi:MAG: GAF domain-containing protein [Anaerolineales bacterium]|nr:GAF domain-containing protein [Anaerolineales bacterium]
MKHPSEIKLNVFGSLLLGGIGTILLLIPVHLGIKNSILPDWAFMLLGAVFFGFALSLQIISALNVPIKRARVIQWLAVLLIFLSARVYQQSGYSMEGGVLYIFGIMQAAVIAPGASRMKQFDFLEVTIALIGFFMGLYLAISNIYIEVPALHNLNAYLSGAFLVTAFFGATAFILPDYKYSRVFFRSQIAPWMASAIILIPSIHSVTFLIPVAVILIILLSDFLPWNMLSVADGDILSRRVIMVAAIIELTLLVFLSGMLLILDHSLDISAASIISVRGAAFIFFALVTVVVYYEALTVIMTINGLMQELTKTEDKRIDTEITIDWQDSAWNSRLARYIKPFMLTHESIRIRINAQADKIESLTQQLGNEKKRNAQLTLLMELSQQLENQLDQPVAAQLTVNTLERALHCSLATIYLHEPEKKEFMLLAAAGHNTSMIPTGYRQSASTGVIGRAYRQRKTQIVNNIPQDPDYLRFENEQDLSALVIPLIFNGHVNGVITLSSENVNGFSSIDIGLAEAAAAELTRAWERSGYHQRLMNLIQSGSQLSSMVEPGTTAREAASIAREILHARFTFVHIQLGQERNFIQSASSGNAPHLLESLATSASSEALIQTALQASQPFRVRDVRKFPNTAHLVIDNPSLRSLLAIPIRWHHMNIGVILAFGKQNEVFFAENDESLAELLSIQTAGAFESTWLQQELRSSLRITSLLYRLSNQIILAENLEDAASDIARTAHKLARNTVTGIVLLNPDGSIASEKIIDSTGMHRDAEHPMKLIQDAMESGQMIYYSQGQAEINTCLPIQTPIRKYGAIWMNTPDEPGNKPSTNPNDLQALVNQAAIALERSLLLVESRRQAVEIKAAYDTLEATYDQTLASLTSALDARDRETEGHSLRVSQLAVQLGQTLGFSHEQLKILERGSLLHDIGKIGISDNILHKPGPLSEEEWVLMREHPDIGAKIVEGIPFLQETISLIRHHQERWDGTGYPAGFRREEIPYLARLFAVVDAFDALTSNRPYRQKIATREALQYIREQANILFDPQIVDAFEAMMAAWEGDHQE